MKILFALLLSIFVAEATSAEDVVQTQATITNIGDNYIIIENQMGLKAHVTCSEEFALLAYKIEGSNSYNLKRENDGLNLMSVYLQFDGQIINATNNTLVIHDKQIDFMGVISGITDGKNSLATRIKGEALVIDKPYPFVTHLTFPIAVPDVEETENSTADERIKIVQKVNRAREMLNQDE